MANSELYGKTYRIPTEVLKYINATLVSNQNADGVKRAKFLVKNGSITYQAMKRLKNYFDYYNPNNGDKVQYALAGGDLMKKFIDTTLNSERTGVNMSKNVRQDVHVDPNLGIKAYQTPRLNETNEVELKKNAIAIIVNNDNKILLLKRADINNSWMPNKWALVGGGIEKGETPQQAVEREIFEETGLKINEFVKAFTLKRNPNSIEHVFACRYNGDPTNIYLDENENVNYGWYDLSEMNFLDTVPNLSEYILLSFKKYD